LLTIGKVKQKVAPFPATLLDLEGGRVGWRKSNSSQY